MHMLVIKLPSTVYAQSISLKEARGVGGEGGFIHIVPRPDLPVLGVRYAIIVTIETTPHTSV